jgi:hypothetical protein
MDPPKLSPFEGKPSNWGRFWGLFKASYDDQESLSPVEKMAYLLPLLRGPAADAVAGIAVEGENYELVKSILVKRFENRERKREELLKKLLSTEPFSLKDVVHLRRQVDRCVAIVRELRADQQEVGNDFLRARFELLLPPRWKEGWVRKKTRNKGPLSFQTMVEFLEEETLILELSSDESPSKSEFKSESPKEEKKLKPLNILAASTYDQEQETEKLSCCVCGEEELHRLMDCRKFMSCTPQERTAIVQRERRCFRCLGNHLVADCKSNRSCPRCQKKHHHTLCFSFPPASAPSPAFDPSPEQTSVATASVDPSTVLTMTASCTAVGPRGTRRARILFDGGSDASFITSELAEALGLVEVGSGFFACVGVQGKGEPRRRYSRVQVELQSLFGPSTSRVGLWVMKKLCAPLKPRVLPPHPPSIPIADDGQAGPVDILVGSDLFYQFIGDVSVPLSPSLRAIETSLGWVFHGNRGGPADELARRIARVSIHRLSTDEGEEEDEWGPGGFGNISTEEEKGSMPLVPCRPEKRSAEVIESLPSEVLRAPRPLSVCEEKSTGELSPTPTEEPERGLCPPSLCSLMSVVVDESVHAPPCTGEESEIILPRPSLMPALLLREAPGRSVVKKRRVARSSPSRRSSGAPACVTSEAGPVSLSARGGVRVPRRTRGPRGAGPGCWHGGEGGERLCTAGLSPARPCPSPAPPWSRDDPGGERSAAPTFRLIRGLRDTRGTRPLL